MYVKGQYGTVQDGKPVYTEWNDTCTPRKFSRWSACN